MRWTMAVITTSLVGIVLGQLAEAPWNQVVPGGALAVLAWALWHTWAKYLPSQQKTFQDTLNNICARHDTWEQLRHDDSIELRKGLAELTSNCMAMHVFLRESGQGCRQQGDEQK